MIKAIINAIYAAFISIFLISIILAAWTSYVFVSHSSKSIEITNVIHDIYVSQKSVFIDVIDLSKILIKDLNDSKVSESNNFLAENELPLELEENPLLDKKSITEDNGDNPLGIVIEPSLPEISVKTLPEITEEPLDDKQSEVSMSEMEIGMEIN